jgi:hypothetical protein
MHNDHGCRARRTWSRLYDFHKTCGERLGRIYKNCKAHMRIGWIFSTVTMPSEYTLKNLGKAQSLHYTTIGNAYPLG